jgi:pilus assembly protein CpaB
MRAGNVVMLLIALVCAAVAALLSRAWLVGQTGKQQSAETTPSRAIVVAARDLKPGEILKPDILKTVPWASNTLPKGAFLDSKALLRPGQPRMLKTEIAENEPILASKLQKGDNALVSKLNSNMHAFTIRVNDVAGLAGLVGPGDYVDVFLTYHSRGDMSSNNKSGVVVLLQNVRVLAVDQATERSKGKGKGKAPKSVTLEVNTEGAQKLALAGQVGQLSLALKRFDGTVNKENTRPIAIHDFLPSQQPKVADKRETQPGPSVTVIRAGKREAYSVVPENRR